MNTAFNLDLALIKSLSFNIKKTIELVDYAYSLKVFDPRKLNNNPFQLKTNHINELVAAAFGFNTFAALKASLSQQKQVTKSPAAELVMLRLETLAPSLRRGFAEYIAHYVVEHLALMGLTQTKHDQQDYFKKILPIYQHLQLSPFHPSLRNCLEKSGFSIDSINPPPLLVWLNAALINNMLPQYHHRAQRNEYSDQLPLFLQYSELLNVEMNMQAPQVDAVTALITEYTPVIRHYWHVLPESVDYAAYLMKPLKGSIDIMRELSQSRMWRYLDLYDLPRVFRRSIDAVALGVGLNEIQHLKRLSVELQQLNAGLADNCLIDDYNESLDPHSQIYDYGVKLVGAALEIISQTNLNDVMQGELFFNDQGLLMLELESPPPHNTVRFKYADDVIPLSVFDFSLVLNFLLVHRFSLEDYWAENSAFPAIHRLMCAMLADKAFENTFPKMALQKLMN